MAATVLRTSTTFRPSTPISSSSSSSSIKSHINTNKFLCVSSSSSFAHRQSRTLLSIRCRIHHSVNPKYPSTKPSIRFRRFSPFASDAEAAATETTAETEADVEDEQPAQQLEQNSDDAVEETASEADVTDVEEPSSAVIVSLQSYREALASNDESKVAEIEGFLKSIEDEKINLEQKVDSISEQLSSEKARVLRISADFENFRKRTERERLSLVSNAQGELLETLLPVLDNFERAKSQIKVETEQEEKISNSYQNIYKQFAEILGSLKVVPVETVGKPFDPMLHEAIMREDSAEFDEGIVIEEYRKGFQLGDRLLRPAMVKVSAGPGPAKPEPVEPSEQQEGEGEDATANAESEQAPAEN